MMTAVGQPSTVVVVVATILVTVVVMLRGFVRQSFNQSNNVAVLNAHLVVVDVVVVVTTGTWR